MPLVLRLVNVINTFEIEKVFIKPYVTELWFYLNKFLFTLFLQMSATDGTNFLYTVHKYHMYNSFAFN